MNYRLSGIRKLNDIIDHLDVIDKPGVYILYDTKCYSINMNSSITNINLVKTTKKHITGNAYIFINMKKLLKM
jgi:hypothetical protein